MNTRSTVKEIRYVALLRGINVGGNTLIKMGDLKKAFEDLGFTDIKTILASGNVIFNATETDIKKLKQKIEEKIVDTFGLNITVICRTQNDIQDFVKFDPFQHVSITPETRINVTFTLEKPQTSLKIPYVSPDKSVQIVSIADNAVCCVVDASQGKGTTDLMKFLEKEFGKNITTRTWNTVCKIAYA